MNWHEHFRYEDGQLFWIRSRKGCSLLKPAGFRKPDGYIQIGVDYKYHYAHRIIFEMFNYEIPEGMQVDHIDRNRLNNRLENLRLATNQENQRNKYAKGFTWNKRFNAFQAQIMVNKKNKNLGYYKTQEEARAAYLTARSKLFGEFA
jgi:hypothetical protein